MVSISSIIGSFPPASLATADLCRFLTRLLNRKTAEELASLRGFAETQRLPGYPETLNPLLVELIETILRDGIEPSSLEPESIEELLGRGDLQRRLDTRTPLKRIPLRPGMAVTGEIRTMLGPLLQTVNGVGDKLMLISPVEIVQLEGLGWSCPRQPGVARTMQANEAEVIRLAWAGVEECFGWATAALEPWSARFTSITARNNLPAEPASDFLRKMPQDERLALWRVLVEHNRDLELSDEHRPGSKGLHERLRAASLELEEQCLHVMLPIVRHAYQACAIDPYVADGICSVIQSDVDQYLRRVDVVDAAKKRLSKYCPEELEFMLRELSARATAGFEPSMDELVARDLRAFREGLLSRRYRRDVTSLLGMDPLLYTETLMQIGLDRTSLERELKSLVEDARRVSKAQGGGLLGDIVKDRGDRAHQGSLNLGARKQSVAVETATGTVKFEAENPFHGEDQDAPFDSDATVLTKLPAMENPFKQPAMKDLPPLPKPPRRNRPKTDTKITLPPMPEVPAARGVTAERRKSPTEEFASLPLPEAPPMRRAEPARRKSPTQEFDDLPLPEAPERRALPVAKSRAAVTETDFDTLPTVPPSRVTSASPLVTPSQAVEFYEKAFRELQVMERDLLERGPWQDASERLKTLAVETSEIMVALGPAARSGDRDFSLALNKVRVVESYLKRIVPLLDAPPRR